MDRGTPDAVRVAGRIAQGFAIFGSSRKVRDKYRPVLAVDKAKGELMHIRNQPGGWMFITKDSRDTLNFPKGHDLDGRPRYDWVDQPDGSQYGYLVDGALDTREFHVEKPPWL